MTPRWYKILNWGRIFTRSLWDQYKQICNHLADRRSCCPRIRSANQTGKTRELCRPGILGMPCVDVKNKVIKMLEEYCFVSGHYFGGNIRVESSTDTICVTGWLPLKVPVFEIQTWFLITVIRSLVFL